MGMPWYQNSTTTGAKAPYGADWALTPFNISVATYLTGSATYAIQYTLDDIQSATARWFDDSQMPTGTTAAGTTAYAFPVTGIRVNIAAVTGALELKIIQGLPEP